MKLLKREHYVCVETSKNSNKYWIIEQYDSHKVITRYGRVGYTEQSDEKQFGSEYEAEKFFNKKIKEKTSAKTRRDAYTKIEILDTGKVIKNQHISDIAASEIETNSNEVKQLVKWFSDINIHNIISQTSIQYNISEGCFRTPLGIVDSQCINNAKKLLDEISIFEDKNNKECVKKIDLYLRLIPQDLGSSNRKIQIKDVFGSGDLLQKQADIIEGLEAAISQSKPVIPTESERVFKTKLDKLTDEQTTLDIKKRFSQHSSCNRISNIYTVHIEDVANRFLTAGQSIGNRVQLWHATAPRNILSIFKSGLVIPKSYSNGWNHGPGIYFSDRSSKSMQYLSRDKRNDGYYGYMFVADVALGNVYYNTGSNQLNNQYNCRWAYKNNSESQIIIYNTNQCNLLYLLELKG